MQPRLKISFRNVVRSTIEKRKVFTRKNSGETRRELETMRRRDIELTALFKRLFIENVLGKIPNEVFRKLSDDYLAEQKEIQSSIPAREERLETLKNSAANVNIFQEKAKQYTQLDIVLSRRQ